MPLNGDKEPCLQGLAMPDSHRLLQLAVCSEPLFSIAFSCLNGNAHDRSRNTTLAIPNEWRSQSAKMIAGMIYYEKNLPLPSKLLRGLKENAWFIVENGRYVTHIDDQLLSKVLAQSRDDVIAMNVAPLLQAFCEKTRITSQGKLVGLRRFYYDSAQLAPVPDDWPHSIFIKTDVLTKLLIDNALPLAFSGFLGVCAAQGLTVGGLNVGGDVLDLQSEQGLLGLLELKCNSSTKNLHRFGHGHQNTFPSQDSVKISPTARVFGNVVFAENVTIGKNVIIAGPTVISSGAKVAAGAVIRASIIAPGVSVSQNEIVQNRILVDPPLQLKHNKNTNAKRGSVDIGKTHFRTWPRFSYAGSIKRAADMVAAMLVLVLFAPIIPIIALAVKLNSPGPIFFKDRRQGFHGRAFGCIKFRSMLMDADKMQEKLRVANKVDGPQFKMTGDPRITIVGKFLRDTYLDEIPQFFNVLLGQMSIVGPRPSPEAENTLCPPWRDARLSVKPGITGLWQICRTRQPMQDFQEWIHYDIKYVKNLSLKTDLWICWKTAGKMVKSFIRQF